MPHDIVTIPCLSDNYAYLVHARESGETALVDAPEAAPVLTALKERGWRLAEIWLTHHHHDHVGGVARIREETGARVVGAAADAHRLPALDIALPVGARHRFAGAPVAVIGVPGHTVGHIAFHLPGSRAVFTGDSLMALGCGRLFEGTAEQMWASLGRLAALPPETLVFPGHEYTANNARFALTIEPDNAALKTRAAAVEKARAAGRPTVPSRLSEELATNPFLRANLPAVKAALGMAECTDVEVFAEIRRRKDAF